MTNKTTNDPAAHASSLGVAAMGFGAVLATAVSVVVSEVASASPVLLAARVSASTGMVVSVVSEDTSRTWTMRPLDWVTIAVGISAPGLCSRRGRL
ncbi:unannotated protein [freshwater metagenome]|uniref:Unannotated protein n=1 Tax=freshwater metagenome TaxID=449393 RepID=A0A6J6GYJ7_9ZZZZ